jgi:hypothetical protein
MASSRSTPLLALGGGGGFPATGILVALVGGGAALPTTPLLHELIGGGLKEPSPRRASSSSSSIAPGRVPATCLYTALAWRFQRRGRNEWTESPVTRMRR